MLKIGQVGPQVFSDGSEAPLRLGRQGDQIVSELHGRYAEQSVRGNIFFAAALATLTIPANLVSTAPVFTVFNPLGSGVVLSLLDLQFAFGSAPAGPALLALVGNVNPIQTAPATTTALTVRNSRVTMPAGKAQAYSVATLGASPVALRILGGVAAASAITPGYFRDEIAGALTIEPGCAVSLAATASVTGNPSLFWEEIPI